MQNLGKKVNKTELKKIEEFANIYEQVNKNLTFMNLLKKSNNVDFFNSLIIIMNYCSNLLYNLPLTTSLTREAKYTN